MPSLPIPLASGFVPSVKKGDSVTVGQILAERKVQEEVSVNIAEELGVSVQKSGKFVNKNPGDTVKDGDILASKKNMFGKMTAKVVSRADGIVTRFERDTGELFLRLSDTTDDEGEEAIVCPIEGTIALCNNEKIVLDVDKDVILGTRGIGGEFQGEIVSIGQSDESVQLHQVQANIIGKILVGGVVSRDILMKCVGMGVGGVIGKEILLEGLTYLDKKNFNLPIIMIEEEDFKKVKRWNGKSAFMQGETKTILLLQR